MKKTTSTTKLAFYAEIRALDRAAAEIAERERIPLVDAYPMAIRHKELIDP